MMLTLVLFLTQVGGVDAVPMHDLPLTQLKLGIHRFICLPPVKGDPVHWVTVQADSNSNFLRIESVGAGGTPKQEVYRTPIESASYNKNAPYNLLELRTGKAVFTIDFTPRFASAKLDFENGKVLRDCLQTPLMSEDTQ